MRLFRLFEFQKFNREENISPVGGVAFYLNIRPHKDSDGGIGFALLKTRDLHEFFNKKKEFWELNLYYGRYAVEITKLGVELYKNHATDVGM